MYRHIVGLLLFISMFTIIPVILAMVSVGLALCILYRCNLKKIYSILCENNYIEVNRETNYGSISHV